METPLRCRTNQILNAENGAFNPPETPLLRRIGYGTGVGVYHLERKSHLSGSPRSPWAIKKVLRRFKHKNFGKLLETEATLLKQLNHPNIVGFRGFTLTKDGREVLAMEQCTVSLGDMIEDRLNAKLKFYSAQNILTVINNVAKALVYLHNEMLLMHGDIKSFNILINGNFEAVKLCDFGVSINVDQDGKALGLYIGTPVWSAPEALSNENVTTKADIFSLAIVIYEMIALQPPHMEIYDDELPDDDVMIPGEENYGKRPQLPEISFGKEYNLILEMYNKCTEEDPGLRFSAKEIVKKLEGFVK